MVWPSGYVGWPVAGGRGRGGDGGPSPSPRRLEPAPRQRVFVGLYALAAAGGSLAWSGSGRHCVRPAFDAFAAAGLVTWREDSDNWR